MPARSEQNRAQHQLVRAPAIVAASSPRAGVMTFDYGLTSTTPGGDAVKCRSQLNWSICRPPFNARIILPATVVVSDAPASAGGAERKSQPYYDSITGGCRRRPAGSGSPPRAKGDSSRAPTAKAARSSPRRLPARSSHAHLPNPTTPSGVPDRPTLRRRERHASQRAIRSRPTRLTPTREPRWLSSPRASPRLPICRACSETPARGAVSAFASAPQYFRRRRKARRGTRIAVTARLRVGIQISRRG